MNSKLRVEWEAWLKEVEAEEARLCDEDNAAELALVALENEQEAQGQW